MVGLTPGSHTMPGRASRKRYPGRTSKRSSVGFVTQAARSNKVRVFGCLPPDTASAGHSPREGTLSHQQFI
jgi:hypothetical protein